MDSVVENTTSLVECQRSFLVDVCSVIRPRAFPIRAIPCEEAVDQTVVGLLDRHLTWPTCFGRNERVLLCARILIVCCDS